MWWWRRQATGEGCARLGGKRVGKQRLCDRFRGISVASGAKACWPWRRVTIRAAARGSVVVVGIDYPDRTTFAYSPVTGTWTSRAPYPAPSVQSQLQSPPYAAVKVMLNGLGYVLTLGSSYFFSDGSEGPAPSFLYAP